METKMSILFYEKRKKMTSDSLLPIYLRVTIDSRRFEVTTKRYIEASKWSIKAAKVKGNTESQGHKRLPRRLKTESIKLPKGNFEG
jgi:Arm DNA-binding domain